MLATNTIKTISLSFFFFCFTINSNAQGRYGTVTSQNINSVISDIDSSLGTMIEIQNQQIYNFLNSFLQGSNPPLISPPTTSVFAKDSSSLTLNWSPVSGATEYKYGFINLKNGVNNSFSSTPSRNDLYAINNIPNDLYLLAIQSYKGGIKSGVSIIIEDKVILKVVFSDQIGCTCPYYTNTQVLDDTWPSLIPDKDFQLRINNIASGQDIGVIHGKRSGSNVLFNIKCPSPNLDIIENNHILYFISNSQYIGAFTFSPESYFVANNHQMLFSYCSDSPPYPYKGNSYRNSNPDLDATTASDFQNINVYPNPFTDNFTINIPPTEAKEVVIQLYSASGKLIKEERIINENIGALYRKEMKTSNLKKGYYICTIKAGDQIKQLPIVKM